MGNSKKKNAIFIGVSTVIVLVTLFYFGVIPFDIVGADGSDTNQMTAGTFNFETVSSNSDFNIGDWKFTHDSLDCRYIDEMEDYTDCKVHFTFDGQSYTMVQGESVVLNDFLSVRVNEAKMYKQKPMYEWLFTPVSKYSFSLAPFNNSLVIDDVQQKLLNNDEVKVNLCNGLDNNLDGGLTTVEDYEYGVSNVNLFDNMIPDECKEYVLNMSFAILGVDKTLITSYFYFNDVKLQIQEKDVLFKLCDGKWITGDCDGELSDTDVQEMDTFNQVSTRFKIYAQNNVYYPFIVVNEIRERKSIYCTATSDCPENYECIYVQGKSICNNIDATNDGGFFYYYVNQQNPLYTNRVCIIIILTAILIMGIVYFAIISRKKGKRKK